jgi:hypothetical protein
MDFNFSNMSLKEAEEKCRAMWRHLPPLVAIMDVDLITFLNNDPGFADRQASLKGDVTYERRINKRTGATAFYAVGSEGGETWASWPNALRAVMGLEMAPRSPWDAVFAAFYDPVKSDVYAAQAEGKKLTVPFNDILFAWMTINGFSKVDLNFNTPENVCRFSSFFKDNAIYVAKKRKASDDGEGGSAAKRSSFE